MTRSVRRIVVICVAILLFAELFTRLAAGRLPEPLTWYHASAQVKVEQMEEMRASSTTADYVLAGTSQVAEGVDPQVFSQVLSSHPSTYNAAVLAAYPIVNARFIPEEVVPRLRPKTVVFGVALTDLQPDKEPPYDTALATDRSFLAGLDRSASQYSYLLRYRRELRDPEQLASLAAGGGSGEVEFYRDSVIGDWGGWKKPELHGCDETSSGQLTAPNYTFTLDPHRADEYWSTVQWMQSQGIRVVVAVMPFADCWFREFHTADANKAARAAIAERGAAVGVPVIDLSDQVHDDSFFNDPGHLNTAGKQHYTELLADAVNHLPG